MWWFLELSQQGTDNTRDHHDLSAGLRQFHRNRSDKSLSIANFRSPTCTFAHSCAISLARARLRRSCQRL